MGTKKKADQKVQSRALSLTVNAEGEANYDAIAKRGHSSTRNVQTSFQDLIPLRQRAHQSGSEISLEKPSQEVVDSTTQRTQLAIQKILDAKLGANKPKTIAGKQSEATYVRYTPSSRLGDNSGHEQRIIKMVDLPEDPLAPPKFKHKKVPGRPPSPPAPVLRSPPRKLTAQDQEAWYIPPSVSNWKNPKGFTIALDKRVAADGRRLEKAEINDNFAKLSEALAVADRKAREEIGQRAAMQQKLAERENAAKEERLRELAQQAREERERSVVGRAPRRQSPSLERNRSFSPTNRHSLSFSDNSEDESRRKSYYSGSEDEVETAEERKRREYREDKKREAERELRRSRMGQERRARDLARDRDISEKVALGVAQPTKPANPSEAQFDSRLFGTISSSIGSGYNEDQVYDKSLFAAREAVQSIYRARGGAAGSNNYSEEDGQAELDKLSRENRFDSLGRAPKSFEGANAEAREGPVEFEKDTTGGLLDKADDDPFGVGQIISEVQRNKKYGLEKPNARGSSPCDNDRDPKRSKTN